MNYLNKSRNSLYASIIGDALGVPVESSTRQELALCSVKNMLGYGRFDQPKGTWSDDSSMILCSMDSLIQGYNLNQMATLFCSWLFDAKHTASGYVFDAGLTTTTALESIHSHEKNAFESGGISEDDNGNGSLMRVLPVALYFSQEPINSYLEKIHEISAITHAHPRSKIGCGIYALFIRNLLKTEDKKKAFEDTIIEATGYYNKSDSIMKNELPFYSRIFSKELLKLPMQDIYSSGYIVHTLEAAIWCFMNHSNTKGILLKAVNLGLDTDTTGTVAGGLAGLIYGLDEIPKEWIDTLAKKTMIDDLIDKYIKALSSRVN